MTALCTTLAAVPLFLAPLCQEVPERLSSPQLDAVLILAGWPPHLLDEARAVTWCESSWRPAADGGWNRGLFQVAWEVDDGTAFTGWRDWAWSRGLYGHWADPFFNAQLAYLIYQRNGWDAWPHCQPEEE